MAKALTLVFLSLLIVNFPVIQSQGEDDSPYFYYYSDTSSSFFIENGTGSDRQVLAEFERPENQAIFGPGWSPSGNWFAWYSGYPGSGGNTNGTAMIINHDGGDIIQIDEDCNTNLLEWSPRDDLILVGCYRDGTFDYIYRVFNPLTQEIILTIDAEFLGLSGFILDITKTEWVPSGNYLAVYYAINVNIDETNYRMALFLPDGTLTYQRDFYSRHLIYSKPYWSISDTVTYIAPDQSTLVVENFQENQQSEFEISTNTLGWVDWSPDGNYALIYGNQIAEYSDDSDYTNPLWLLSLPDESLRLLSQTARPLILRYRNQIGLTSTWSPSGDSAFIVDTSNTIYMINPSSGELSSLYTSVDGRIFPQFIHWFYNDRNLAVLEISADNSISVSTLLTFDLTSNQLVSTRTAPIVTFGYSSTGRYLAYGSRDCDGICIVDMTDEVISRIPIETRYGTSSAFDLLWHSERDWLIATGPPDGGLRSINVTDISGNFQRVIGECLLSLSCFGWMPSNWQPG